MLQPHPRQSYRVEITLGQATFHARITLALNITDWVRALTFKSAKSAGQRRTFVLRLYTPTRGDQPRSGRVHQCIPVLDQFVVWDETTGQLKNITPTRMLEGWLAREQMKVAIIPA